MGQLEAFFGKKYPESRRKSEEQQTETIKNLQYWNKMALIELEKLDRKVVTIKEKEEDQSLEPNDNSTHKKASIKKWNDFWAICKKNKLSDIDGETKTKKQSTKEVEARIKAYQEEQSWLYPPKRNKNLKTKPYLVVMVLKENNRMVISRKGTLILIATSFKL